jgi:hypothetical protein
VTSSGRLRLPGLRTETELYQALDPYRREFGLLLTPVTGHAGIVLEVQPSDGALAEPAATRRWLDALAGWLAQAGQPDLVACTVAVHRTAGRAPRVLVQPSWLTTGPLEHRDPPALAVELGARLPHLIRALAVAAIGGAEPVPAAGIVELVAAAYTPTGQPDARVPDARTAWAASGPRASEDLWDRFGHDSAVSRTWIATAPIPDRLIPCLLTHPAHPDRGATRICLLHRPRPAAEAGRPEAGPDRYAENEADHSFGHEVEPGPEPDLACLVTVTAESTGDLAAATDRLLAGLPAPVRPWLRPLYGGQAAGFAAGLPTGALLELHAAAPAVVGAVDPP